MLPATRMGREPCRYIEAYGGKKGVAVGRVCWGLWLCSTRWHYYFHDLRVDRAATGARDELLNTVAAFIVLASSGLQFFLSIPPSRSSFILFHSSAEVAAAV